MHAEGIGAAPAQAIQAEQGRATPLNVRGVHTQRTFEHPARGVCCARLHSHARSPLPPPLQLGCDEMATQLENPWHLLPLDEMIDSTVQDTQR